MEGTRRPVPHDPHLSAAAPYDGPRHRLPSGSGAMLYYDAQVDDARYTLTVAAPRPRTAP